MKSRIYCIINIEWNLKSNISRWLSGKDISMTLSSYVSFCKFTNQFYIVPNVLYLMGSMVQKYLYILIRTFSYYTKLLQTQFWIYCHFIKNHIQMIINIYLNDTYNWEFLQIIYKKVYYCHWIIHIYSIYYNCMYTVGIQFKCLYVI